MRRLWVLSSLAVLVLAACVALPAPLPGPAQSAPPAATHPDVAEARQGLLDAQVREQGILGMVMAVRLPDGTVVSRVSGYTDPDRQTPWTTDTVSHLGSVTKSYTGVVVMQLVEEGRLSLDDTIDRWFPDQPNGDKITVRMLLSHTSGLSEFMTSENYRDPRWSEEFSPLEVLAEANRLGPVGEPGSPAAHYANTNYFALGLIVEAITGDSWEQAVRSRIIEPLGLKHTAFVSDNGVRGGMLVEGYFKTPDGYLGALEVPDYPSVSTAWANGGIVSSLADLMTFAAALFDGTLVSQETLTLMATPVGKDVADGRPWGLGGGTIEGVPGSFGMGGDAEAYHAFFAGIQGTGIVVAALVNTAEGEVIGPSFMALEYLLSPLVEGEAPAR